MELNSEKHSVASIIGDLTNFIVDVLTIHVTRVIYLSICGIALLNRKAAIVLIHLKPCKTVCLIILLYMEMTKNREKKKKKKQRKMRVTSQRPKIQVPK